MFLICLLLYQFYLDTIDAGFSLIEYMIPVAKKIIQIVF